MNTAYLEIALVGGILTIGGYIVKVTSAITYIKTTLDAVVKVVAKHDDDLEELIKDKAVRNAIRDQTRRR